LTGSVLPGSLGHEINNNPVKKTGIKLAMSVALRHALFLINI